MFRSTLRERLAQDIARVRQFARYNELHIIVIIKTHGRDKYPGHGDFDRFRFRSSGDAR